MSDQPIQNFYPDDVAICYGCGRLNSNGLHIQTIWNGEEGIGRFTPKPEHTAFPGFVYGGLLASLIDCNGTGTATAATYHAEGHEPGTEPEVAYVTGTLTVKFLKPTPLGPELVIRSRVKELHPKKAIISCSIYANDEECVRGEVIAIRVQSRALMGQ
jgi:acyl-coenzyme A thioesterase PaaI-like protein